MFTSMLDLSEVQLIKVTFNSFVETFGNTYYIQLLVSSAALICVPAGSIKLGELQPNNKKIQLEADIHPRWCVAYASCLFLLTLVFSCKV